MFRTAILILTILRALLVEGVETGKIVENKTEIDSNSSRRILFGQRGQAEEFPYLVRIRLAKGVCGGSIITNHWILTAAHCIRAEICNHLKIVPAAWRISEKLDPDRCYVHERHGSGPYHEYDVALIKVKQDSLKDGRTKTVKLPPPGAVYPPGKVVFIAGWGATEEKKLPTTLLRAVLLVDKWEKCDRIYRKHYPEITRGMPVRTLCLHGDGPRPAGTCLGDSGGPAVTADGVIIGIASFIFSKNNFCMLGGPSVFVSVVDYLPWIYRHIDPNKDTKNFPVRPEN